VQKSVSSQNASECASALLQRRTQGLCTNFLFIGKSPPWLLAAEGQMCVIVYVSDCGKLPHSPQKPICSSDQLCCSICAGTSCLWFSQQNKCSSYLQVLHHYIVSLPRSILPVGC